MTTVLTKGEIQTFPAELTAIHCGDCGGIYAINERYRKEKHDKGGGWNCPYCKCSWGFFGETETQKQERLRKEAEERLARERAAFDQEKASLRDSLAFTESRRRAEKGAKTKLKKRAANGLCPCCNRYFANVHRHIQNQHPAFGATADADETQKG